jgi:cobalt/nickel transport system permease protein
MAGTRALASGLHVDVASPVHRIAPQCKLLATLLFVIAVVGTPREAFLAFGVHAVLLGTVAALARLPLLVLLRRMAIELPFVLFALLLPIVGRGERVDVLGLSLSVSGLWAAWNILAKATLGVAATGLLAATTPVPEILRGLERLRLPRVFVAICSFMVRYADVVAGELHRMRVARVSRGHDPRWIWQARAVASTAGALFVRSYERGERVYLAMVARGYDGAMPTLGNRRGRVDEWLAALAVPAVAALTMVVAWMVR